jgi:CubicO group peptidase (beta-lactamase class C family)
MLKYEKYVGRDTPEFGRAAKITKRYDTPLMFEPGESWIYGTGFDWAGLVVERLTGMSLEDYGRKNLWEPLGATSITFWPQKNSMFQDKLVAVAQRGEDGKFGPSTDSHLNTFSTDCFGGAGYSARMGDFVKVQQSLLTNDGKLLMPESVEELFRPLLKGDALEAVNKMMRSADVMFMNELNRDIPVNQALGGLVFMEDDEGRRKKGTLTWGGMFNSFWSIDREAGIAMAFGVVVLPPGDPGCSEMASLSEKAIYKMAAVYASHQ